MSASVFKINADGNGTINAIATVPSGSTYRLAHVTIKFDVAPTTSENLTITLDANAGSQYDVLLYSVDPAAGADNNIVWIPDDEVFLEGSDKIDVDYAGTDGRAYGVQITLKAV